MGYTLTMFELIATVLNDPEKIFPYPTYPSGVLEGDSTLYKFAYPSTDNPVVRTAFTLYDNDGNSIAPGFYEVALTNDRKFLVLIQSRKILASVPVVKIEEKQIDEYQQNEKELEKVKNAKKEKRNNKKDTTELKQQARLKATITDSGDGYFILDYQTEFIKAKGYIPY